MTTKTRKTVLYRPTDEEQRMIDQLLAIALRKGYSLNTQDVIRKAIRRDHAAELQEVKR